MIFNNQYNELSMPQSINPYQNMDYMMQAPEKKLDIGKFMKNFNNTHREKFNDFWFERKDEDIVNGMKDIIMSCQRDKYFVLKVIDFEVIKDYDKIHNTLHDYYAAKRKNGKPIENPYDYINLRDSDIMLLKVKYYIKINIPEDKIRKDPKTGELEKTEGVIDVLIELPIYVDKYYFRIQGNYYYPVFQIVDGSTYNNVTSNSTKNQTITLKTQFMPIKVYKECYTLTDFVDGSEHKCILYTCYVFKKKTDACRFILGRYGLYGAMEMLGIEGIYVSKYGSEPLNPEVYYNFVDPQNKIMVSVIKRLFDLDNVTESFVYTILRSVKRLEDYNDIANPRFWNKVLGSDFMSFSLDKGIPVLDSLETIYDLRTKNSIRLPKEEKEDTYCIIRWMIRHFSYLRNKDNINISTKHPRMADEYLPSIYAMRISTGIYRISDKGKNVTFKDVVKVIDTAPDYILKNINQANLVNFVDLVNDDDGKNALAYTYKGISGLGDGTGSSVPQIYRSVHPSHLGKVDLDASSASDPGLSGIICPMAKTYDGFFSDFEEPNCWGEFYKETLNSLHSLYGIKQGIELKKKLGLEYDYVKDDMVKETISTYRKIIPGIIDVNGKKDYTLGAIMCPREIISEGDDEGVGEISVSYEELPALDED